MIRSALALILLTLALAATAQQATPVIPLKPDPPIAIDGDLKEWAGVPNAITVNTAEHATYNPEKWHGPQDLSAIVHLAWRYEGLYLGLEITDDVVAQTQRDEKMFQGDHVEVYLDFTPDLEPTRRSFGPGQFQFAFSPGNFKHTGDALVDIPPEVYCYQPKGGSCEGIKYAAMQTPQGWTLEAMIPFALLKVTPQPNLPLGLEVAFSDTDSPEPAQEKMVTLGAAKWEYSRQRLQPFVLGNVAGQGAPPPRTVPVADKLEVLAGKSGELTFPSPDVPAGKEAYLFFRARIPTPRPAGYTQILRLKLNGQDIQGTRLSNRPMKSRRVTGFEDGWVTPAGTITVPYSPDFTSFDKDPYYGPAGNIKANEYEFKIGDLLVKGNNVLVLTNQCPAGSGRDLAFADIALRVGSPPPPPVPKRPAPTGPLPVIAPRMRLKTDFTVQEAAGRLVIGINGEQFTVETRFSTPEGVWQTGSCKFFDHSRRIERKDECVIVYDTFKNLTGANLPLCQRHTCDLKGRQAKVWLSGISPSSGNLAMSEPENPTSYATTAKAGLGLMPLNDEFLVHVTNSALDGILGLSDSSYVLKAGGSYTAEWTIIPTAAPDFWDFVNAARRVRNANFTLKEQFAFLRSGPLTEKWSDEVVTKWIKDKGATVVCDSISYPLYNGHYTHGTSFQYVDHAAAIKHNQRVRRLVPGIKTQTYFHCFLDVRDESPDLYADDRLLLANGKQGDYGEPWYRIFIPTLTNKFGPAVAKNLDIILDEIKCDGVYWDEMDYSAYKYHYGEPWDGCSGDIDQTSGKLLRLKSSVSLISLPFREYHVKRIMARGPLVANGCPHTRTMADLHYQCFVETASLSNCLRAVLYSPVALGDHISERTELDAYRWMTGALDYGCLYNWYPDVLIPDHPTLTSYMFPTTPLELHEGFIIGKERIVTNTSGVFGWGDNSPREVHVLDDTGTEVPDFKAPSVSRDGATYTELRIAEGWTAAIVRK